MDAVRQLDTVLFNWINQDGGHHYAWLDATMMFLSEPANGLIPFLLIGGFAFWKSGRDAWAVVGLMVVLVLFSDWSGALIKHAIAAERPCDTIASVRLLASYCGRNSFPSNHAMNMAAVAMFVGLRYRILAIPLAVLALLVGLSRIYIGVHYPGDVLFGWMWGALLAAVFYGVGRHYLPTPFQQRKGAASESGTNKEQQ